MKILLFGGSGQLGLDLLRRAADLNFEVVAPVISEVNISDRDQVLFLANQAKPDLVINCAAYTNVDAAEDDQSEAFLVNKDGAAIVARAAKEVGARMIHISTDYVFDGRSQVPYLEQDKVNPLNVYGRSKLEGEQEVLEILGEKALIARTAWLHGARGKNFVQTILKLVSEKDHIRVVDDQIGSPTWSGWLAEVLLDLGRTDASGIMHVVCSGSTSWYGFAREILELVRDIVPGVTRLKLEPQTTAEAKRKALRPANSVLNCDKLKMTLGRELMTWQDGLKAHLIELGVLKAHDGD